MLPHLVIPLPITNCTFSSNSIKSNEWTLPDWVRRLRWFSSMQWTVIGSAMFDGSPQVQLIPLIYLQLTLESHSSSLSIKATQVHLDSSGHAVQRIRYTWQDRPGCSLPHMCPLPVSCSCGNLSPLARLFLKEYHRSETPHNSTLSHSLGILRHLANPPTRPPSPKEGSGNGESLP